jgi:DNA-3-methyladenine glycosylase
MEEIAQIKTKMSKSEKLPGSLLPRAFFEDVPDEVAPRLLGKLLVHKHRDGVLAGRIVEIEAYLGPHNDPPDRAAHAHRGPTPRNLVLFGPAGHAYVYAIYGMHFCMNISCETDGLAGSVLLRALDPVSGVHLMAANRGLAPEAPARLIAFGPGRLCQALGLTRPIHNGMDITNPASPLQVRDDGYPAPLFVATPRIGIRHAVDLPLRFALHENGCVSGPKSPVRVRNPKR